MNPQQYLFHKNFELCKKYRAELAGFLLHNISPNIQFIECKNGSISAKYKNRLIHSSVNPVKEAEGFVRRLDISEGDCVLLYGFGLGYHLLSFLKVLGDDGRLLVVEANTYLLSSAFYACDLSGIIKDPRLQIISGRGEQEIASRLSRFLSTEWGTISENKKKVAIHAPSFSVIPEGFERIKNSFELLLMERRFDVLFGEIEKENIRLNKKLTLQSAGAQKFFNKYNGRTGILIGAGPSLDANKYCLKTLSKNSLIVSVDTSFPILIKYGIRPEFVVTVDPQEFSIRHFIECLDEDIPLVFVPTANSKVMRSYKGKKIVIIQEKKQMHTIAEIERLAGSKGITIGGGSVSCVALDFLIKLGADPIVLIGQDCAYPDMRRYAHGTVEDNDLMFKVNRYQTLEGLHKHMINRKKVLSVKDKFGTDIPTHQHLYSYLRYTEAIIYNSGDKTFFNLASQGARIEGTKNISSPWEVEQIRTQVISSATKTLRHKG